ncbi:hypothetical protein BGX23_003483 [Mortierella sp. AD031]|nr:hypothetical protein BGX23_003483 [Mortierella sp. AD031]
MTSSAFSTTSLTATLACPGHFHDYSCALEREILWQGTLFVAATHVCFYGKHFGKTVKVIIDYRDLVLIEREKKMGVFPSSIRLRVTTPESSSLSSVSPSSQGTKDNTSITHGEPRSTTLPGTQATKDYVLTSLISREQAFADIERSWLAHRQFLSVCSTGLPTPQIDSPGGSEKNMAELVDHGDVEGGCGLKSRASSRHFFDRYKIPRTYSVISDEAISSSENLNRLHLRERTSTSFIRSSTPISQELISTWAAAAAVEASTAVTDSRRGSVASIGSSDRQESPSGLVGFFQRRSSLVHTWKKNEGSSGGDSSDSNSDTPQDQSEDVIASSLEVAPVATTSAITPPFVLEDSTLLMAQRQNDTLRSTTPPPTLISPSLTTTKVSRSLSTVQTDATPGSTHGMTKHIRGESSDALLIAPEENGASAQSCNHNLSAFSDKESNRPTPQPVLPSGPVSCECSRHYKNAVVSTVVAVPVELCFEILFSGAGAGLGDKLGCDTHRIKDGSTDILIMPWQHEDQGQVSSGVNGPAWEDQQRKLEYSVSFKVPMLAKTSTACFETQKVIQFRPFAILVHSESRTPNVPYGEHFSTVNQICMTWESEGKTRIKCFTEVKFKRSIMWSSKVEAGSLEGSGGFYKEFIRQFEQLVDSQGEQLLRAYESRNSVSTLVPISTDDEHGPAMATTIRTVGSVEMCPSLTSRSSLESIQDAPGTGEGVFVLVPVQEASHPEALEMSRARSLLSQQFLRNPPSNSIGLPRLSLDSARPSLVGHSPFVAQKSPLSTSSFPAKKKSSLSVFIQPLTPPVYPIVSTAPEGPISGDEKASAPAAAAFGTATTTVRDADSPSSSSVQVSPWADLVRRGVTLFSRSVPPIIDAETSSSEGGHTSRPSPGPGLRSPATLTNGHGSGGRTVDRTGSPRVTFAASTISPTATHTGTRWVESPSRTYLSKGRYTHQQGGQDRQHQPATRGLSRILLGFVILGLAVSALNIWHLFSVVSSMVEVVQLKEDVFQRQVHHAFRGRHPYPSEYSNYYWRPSAWTPSSSLNPAAVQSHQRSRSHSSITSKKSSTPDRPLAPNPAQRAQKHSLEESRLGPLHIQSAILRTEITELFDLLEQARKELHHPHHRL